MTIQEMDGLRNQEADDQFVHIWRDFESAIAPDSWRIWPHSESKGWCDRIENKINYE
jgi:hypothetical protein